MVTLAAVVVSGFCMVRYSWKPPPTLPPAIYHVVLAGGTLGRRLVLSRTGVVVGAAFVSEEHVKTLTISRRASNGMTTMGERVQILHLWPLKEEVHGIIGLLSSLSGLCWHRMQFQRLGREKLVRQRDSVFFENGDVHGFKFSTTGKGIETGR
jgi:hypothetical protein